MLITTNVSSINKGLSSTEAASLLKLHGFNELEAAKKHSAFGFLWKIFREPMFLLLIGCALLYFILGSISESLILLSFVVVIMAITSYQERKSENALTALRNLSSPRAFVIRDGKGMRIAGREVVVGDVIVVSEGDCVPADAVILANDLSVDESILTGESISVHKFCAEDLSKTTIENQIFSGTYVVQGKAIAKVTATSNDTKIGAIGKSLQTVKSERTALQQETDYLIKNFAIFGFALSFLIAIIYGVTRGDWIQGFLVGITLAMAILPEEFPVILTIFMALGAWRISLKNVLTRHVPAIETLGSVTVLCTDKTGTITQNCMSVGKIFAVNEYFTVKEVATELPETFHQLIEYGILASQRDPFDPMEIAIKNFGERYLANSEHLHEDWQLMHQYPLSKELLAISLVWQSMKDKDYVIAAKGAPEAIFDLCHLSQQQIDAVSPYIQEMANEGLRVLGVAKASFGQQHLPNEQHDFNFEFLGFIGLADPIRPTVIEAVKNCYTAGVRIIMITGDYAGTAQNIARQIGLRNVENVITGPELTQMNDLELEAKIINTNIFARILPEQKLRIVNALKANNEIVTMTGDGVNDAPALKSANVGIAMGEHGTDVAREAASMVLLDDDFSSIVAAIKLGRRIFDNIKKAKTYIIAVHIPIIGMSLVPVLLKWPLMLLPIHILFLQLIIDPTCAIVFEAENEEPNIMQRPPRKHERLFTKKSTLHSIVQGISVFIAAFIGLLIARHLGYEEKTIRAIVFTILIASNLALIFINLCWTSPCSIVKNKNRALWLVVLTAITTLLLVLVVPALRNLFYFNQLSFSMFITSFILGFASVSWMWLRNIIANC
jgi:Ca2+-transporting ATPase